MSKGFGADNFKYKILEKFPLTDLPKFSEHRRLQVFYHKGCACVSCDKVATHIALGKDKGGGLHFDLYDDEGNAFTIDHIQPKSKGGSNDLDNLQPMCKTCNEDKGNGDVNNVGVKFSNMYKGNFIQKIPEIGDIVYRLDRRRKKVRLIGEVVGFKINEQNPNKILCAYTKECPTSLYALNGFYVKK